MTPEALIDILRGALQVAVAQCQRLAVHLEGDRQAE